MHILVYGADGATGRRIVDQALARGHDVRGSVLAFDPALPRRDRLEWTVGDIMGGDGLDGHMDGIDAVLSATGVSVGLKAAVAPPRLYSEGTRNILDAMGRRGVDRLVTISATFVETMDRGPVWFEIAARIGLNAIVADMARMEETLRASHGVRWTAVRPGWLLDEKPSGDYAVFEDVIPPDLIRTRTGDLAHFMLGCVEDGTYVGETPAIARAEPDDKSGLEAVLHDML